MKPDSLNPTSEELREALESVLSSNLEDVRVTAAAIDFVAEPPAVRYSADVERGDWSHHFEADGQRPFQAFAGLLAEIYGAVEKQGS